MAQAQPETRPSSSSNLSQTTTQNDSSEQQQATQVESVPNYPPKSKAVVIIIGLFLTLFLTALDRLIVGVAIPSITDEFNSLGDVGWYGSAYLLTTCTFMLFMGKVYTLVSPKWVYLSSLFVFEIGSAVSGAAPNSKALIVGRAIAGLGNAGLFQGAVIIFVYILPLNQRPQIMGLGGLVIGVASSLGPLLGGAFTNGPGWRWCFYVNLPCGAVVFVLVLIFLHIPAEMLQRKPTTVKEKITQLDPLGTFFFFPSIICLLLALQWGGITYNWSDARIIVLFVLSGLLFIAFIVDQWWTGENATVPGRIFSNRSILAGTWFTLFNGGSMQTIFYYLPIWFQAIKGASAVKSGIMNLPMVLGLVVAPVSAGFLTKRIGYFTQWMIISSILAPIGAGLISTFTPYTNHPAWIGYQVIFGLGFGFGSQQPSVAAQTILPRKDVPIGASLMMFCQTFGGAIFISVANNLFDSRLTQDLSKVAGLNLGSVVKTGATDLRNMVPANLLPQVLVAYNDALRTAFYVAVALSCCTIVGSLAMEWKSVKKGQDSKKKDADKVGEKV